MSSAPRASVIVPYRDSEATIRACVESLLDQKRVGSPYEVIMVDNGSVDASASIVAEFPDVTRLAESAPGPYAARNTGIQEASAPVIAFTDADCRADPGWLRSILDGMADPRIAILLGHCRYPKDASIGLRFLGSWENAKSEFVSLHGDPAHRFGYCNNMAVRAAVFDEIGQFKEWRRAADTELVHRLAAHRPDLEITYRESMRVTHLEFRRARFRAQRLRLYTQTNARIPTFRELDLRRRLAVVARLTRRTLRQ